MSANIQLIVGLGNPGPEYEYTRHNAGANFVEKLINANHAEFKLEKKFFGLYSKIRLADTDIHCLIPMTFMNRSGQAIAAVARFYKIPVESILVAHDELDIAPGTARFKQGGGHGGHNGLRNTIDQLGSRDFARLRLGIGHPGIGRDVVGYVLKKAPKAERELMTKAIDEALSILPEAIIGNWNKAQTLMNGFKA